jgi:hypothetical protein
MVSLPDSSIGSISHCLLANHAADARILRLIGLREGDKCERIRRRHDFTPAHSERALSVLGKAVFRTIQFQSLVALKSVGVMSDLAFRTC